MRALDRKVAVAFGFDATYPVTGQTYPRKVDAFVLDALSGIGQSAAKMAGDVRLLARLKEVREPLAEGQVGSSAMPYKANPMRSERVTALARWLITMAANPAHTAANQWLERTLDASGLQVFPAMVGRNLSDELPFMASEAILMEAVRRGGDRQEVHERLRVHARSATTAVLVDGEPNPFLELVAGDPAVPLDRSELESLLDPAGFVGRAPQQVREYLDEYVGPLLAEVDDLPQAHDLEV